MVSKHISNKEAKEAGDNFVNLLTLNGNPALNTLKIVNVRDFLSILSSTFLYNDSQKS